MATNSYVNNYIQAINNPLPELKDSFVRELELLKDSSDKDDIVLDVGCGAGRPADLFSAFVRKIICIDNDKNMLDLARQRCKNIDNIEIREGDALHMDFADDQFDLVYATYNLIGSLPKSDRQQLVDEMVRVARTGARIINITWKDNRETTDFLLKYYPSIGIEVISASDSKTVTSKGTFFRVSRQELVDYYTNANIKNINFVDVGPVWIAVVGNK